MPFLPSLDSDAGVPQIYKAHPQIYRPWIKMGEEVMSKEAPLSQAERELIATYVSALNGCSFCRASHQPSMELHGIEAELIDTLLVEIESAPVEERLKPVLAFARKLTLAPADLSQADADAVYAAGWDEGALHSVISVVCRFSFMNRLVMAHGLNPPGESAARVRAEERKSKGYAGMHGGLDQE